MRSLCLTAHPLVIVLVALLGAALACTLSGDQPTVTPLPTPTMIMITPIMATPTLIPTVTPTLAGGFPPTAANCAPYTTWPVYTIAAGDTLGVIAEVTGTTVEQLVTANCLTNAELIFAGQPLYVPRLPPAAAPTATPDPNRPAIRQNLAVQPTWLDASGQPATYSSTVRVNLGEVLNADRVIFYVDDPGGGLPIPIGQDEDPWDGAFVDYTFFSAGSYTFSAVAVNAQAQAASSTYTVRYDPAFVPSGGRPNALTLAPYARFEGGTYTLTPGTTVTITWPAAPITATRVDVLLTPTGGGAAQVIGSDLTPADGTVIAWSVPSGLNGRLQAVATLPGGATQTSEFTAVISG